MELERKEFLERQKKLKRNSGAGAGKQKRRMGTQEHNDFDKRMALRKMKRDQQTKEDESTLMENSRSTQTFS